MGGRAALVTLASLAAGAPPAAIAQPAPPAPAPAAPAAPAAKDPGEIEIEPAPGPAPTPANPAAPSPSPAPSKIDPRLARKWLAAAQQLMQKAGYFASHNRPDDARQQLENAVTAYQRAIEAGDDPSLYLDLAIAEDRLGKLDAAVKHLRQVGARGRARPDAVKKAAARLAELLARVGVVTLTVSPDGASITLGGTELGTAPLPDPLVLLPGTYTLSFQAAGFQPREQEIVVEAGAQVERAIALEPVPVILAPVAPPRPEPPLPELPPPGPSKLPLYVGAGITGAGVVGAAIFGALAIGQHATFTAGSTSPLDRADARSNGKRLALASDLSLATAAVAAGFTACWYFYRYRPQKLDDPRAAAIETKVDVVPWVQSRSGGAALAGWF